MCEVTAEPAPSVDWFKDGTTVSEQIRGLSDDISMCLDEHLGYIKKLNQKTLFSNFQYVIRKDIPT